MQKLAKPAGTHCCDCRIGTLFGLGVSKEDQESFTKAVIAIGTVIGGIASAFYGYQKRKAG